MLARRLQYKVVMRTERKTRLDQVNSTPRDLMDMLTYRRPCESKTETAFIKRFLLPLGVRRDDAGKLIKRIGGAPVLWSSHFDTVHRTAGRQGVCEAGGMVRLAKRAQSNCLGADDDAGVWLMSEMIRAGVEGLYVLHFGEEVGGIGSCHISMETPELLDGIQMAIALDRKGYDSVITHQGERCCSDEFAAALGDALGLGMVPDDTGLFTDTANYVTLVPECTNLSVGYEGAHGRKEVLDAHFLVGLRDRLVKLDCAALPVLRDPVDALLEDDLDWGDDSVVVQVDDWLTDESDRDWTGYRR